MPDASPDTQAQAILRQVEFYFGDSNFPRDKFLQQQSKLNDGWIPIETIMSFKRMQKYTNKDEVVEALKLSKELLQINDDGTALRRVKPVVEQASDADERTLYAVCILL